MRHRQIQVAVGMRHQPHQVQRVRLAGPHGEHLLAGDLGLVGLSGIPMRTGACESLADIQRHVISLRRSAGKR